ncbi:DNA-protecting protein DprA [bacterium]|nr:DNA-protecting protein DprA [bacterium]
MNILDFHIHELDSMKSYPQMLYYKGKRDLLSRRKISIIGSRRPNQYVQSITYKIANELSKLGVVVVSGVAMGVDAIAHKGAGSENTIAVLPCGIDLRYPAINRSLLESIEQKGLSMSQFEPAFQATNWSFVVRNELVVSLGEVLIVTQADLNSGSMRSVEFALEMGKEIYVLPHRLGESEGTNGLLEKGLAKVIYDIDAFVTEFADVKRHDVLQDEFLEFCKTDPFYDEAMLKYKDRVFEAELEGQIRVQNGKIYLT